MPVGNQAMSCGRPGRHHGQDIELRRRRQRRPCQRPRVLVVLDSVQLDERRAHGGGWLGAHSSRTPDDWRSSDRCSRFPTRPFPRRRCPRRRFRHRSVPHTTVSPSWSPRRRSLRRRSTTSSTDHGTSQSAPLTDRSPDDVATNRCRHRHSGSPSWRSSSDSQRTPHAILSPSVGPLGSPRRRRKDHALAAAVRRPPFDESVAPGNGAASATHQPDTRWSWLPR